ncbi:MAG: YihY/virulence factor BrkB family protein, partial [Anaerolineae bacterium]|nr:YihY/virulence factor BrkB family protein [Anaerolineae bacterium]
MDFKALFKETYQQWKADKASRLAAALSYYTIFSIAPLLIIVIAVAGMVFGQDAAEGKIVEQTEDMVGRDGAEVIQTMLESSNSMSSNVLATVIGIVTLIIGATGVFGHLQESLNTIWGIQVIETGGIL